MLSRIAVVGTGEGSSPGVERLCSRLESISHGSWHQVRFLGLSAIDSCDPRTVVDGHKQVAPHPNAILNNMDDQEQQRSQAILTFLGAGLQQPPHRALAVTALANARRGLAAHRASSQPVDTWLTEQVRHGGIRENAATLAVLE